MTLFVVQEPVFNDGTFEIAYGHWHESNEEDRQLAIRWNRTNNHQWTLISSDFTETFLIALLNSDNKDIKRSIILEILRERI